MRSLSTWLALASIPTLAWASPIDTSAQAHSSNSDNSLEALSKEFKGIYWDEAKETCTSEQFEAIVKATRKADEMTSLAMDNAEALNSAAWNRYFVNDDDGLKDSWADNFELWANIAQSMIQVRDFPSQGKKNSKPRYNKVTYRCRLQEDQACGYPNAASTKPFSGDKEAERVNGFYWTITLCPFFFERLPHIEDWTQKKNQRPGDFNAMQSREGTLIHEFMHANIIGTRKILTHEGVTDHITDIHATPPPYQKKLAVYGDGRAHAFAWQYVNGEKRINKLTSGNADTYGLFFTYHYLAQHFGWTEDGSENYVLAKREGIPSGAVDVNNVQVNKDLEVPETCHKGSKGQPVCTYNSGWEGNPGVGNVPQKCNLDESSGLPAKVFKRMYGQFCKSVDDAEHRFDQGWQVTETGEKMHLIRSRDLQNRSPPVTSKDYPNASAYLNFIKKGDGKCTMSCSEAFDSLTQSNCGTTGGEQSAMAKSGRIDAGCGKYVFSAFTGEEGSKPPTYSGLAPPPPSDDE